MANASSTGFGFQSVMTLGNTPSTQGLSEYPIKSGTAKRFNQNDPCSKQGTGGDDGYLQDAAHTTMADGVTGGQGWDRGAATIQALNGVFNGAFYINSTTSKPTWANTIVESTTFGTDYNTGSSDGVGFVNDNPMQEYVCKADDALGVALMLPSLTYNCENGGTTAKQTSGQSTIKLDVSATAAAGANQMMFNVVRSANDPENKDLTVADANVIVRFAPGSIMSNKY